MALVGGSITAPPNPALNVTIVESMLRFALDRYFFQYPFPSCCFFFLVLTWHCLFTCDRLRVVKDKLSNEKPARETLRAIMKMLPPVLQFSQNAVLQSPTIRPLLGNTLFPCFPLHYALANVHPTADRS